MTRGRRERTGAALGVPSKQLFIGGGPGACGMHFSYVKIMIIMHARAFAPRHVHIGLGRYAIHSTLFKFYVPIFLDPKNGILTTPQPSTPSPATTSGMPLLAAAAPLKELPVATMTSASLSMRKSSTTLLTSRPFSASLALMKRRGASACQATDQVELLTAPPLKPQPPPPLRVVVLPFPTTWPRPV